MKKLLEILKNRWNVDSSWQLLVILIIFSISGMTVLYVRKLSFNWLGFSGQTPLWEEAVAWIFIVIPSYQLLLLIFGSLLGQFEFFWRFEKSNLQRLKKIASKINLCCE